MLKTRVITAVVLLAFFVPVFLFASPLFISILMSILIALGAWEWGRFIWGMKSRNPIYYALFLFILSITFGALLINSKLVAITHHILYSVMWLGILFWILLMPNVLRKKLDFSINQNKIFIAVSGYIVLLSAWYAFLLLFSKGSVFVLSVLLITWTADIGAYFVGKKFGKHKLAPQISPGKSIEGAIGGILAVCLLSICFYNYNTSSSDFFSMIGSKYSVFVLLLVSVCLAMMSILGDLFESQLKRLSGMKDSSNLLPGHGGILDRLDAVLPVLPISAMIVLELF